MGIALPQHIKDTLDEKVMVYIATTLEDGGPHVTAMWIDYEGDNLLFSTAAGRVKANNLLRDPRVSIAFVAAGDAYHPFTIQGRVVKTDTDGKYLINRLAKKYLDLDEYPWTQEGEVRFNCVVEVDSITG